MWSNPNFPRGITMKRGPRGISNPPPLWCYWNHFSHFPLVQLCSLVWKINGSAYRVARAFNTQKGTQVRVFLQDNAGCFLRGHIPSWAESRFRRQPVNTCPTSAPQVKLRNINQENWAKTRERNQGGEKKRVKNAYGLKPPAVFCRNEWH